jgi:hypothetical protein
MPSNVEEVTVRYGDEPRFEKSEGRRPADWARKRKESEAVKHQELN